MLVPISFHGDHGLGTWENLGLRPPLAPQIHLSFQLYSHRENVTAPTGRPNLRSRLYFSHSEGGETTKSERTCGGIGGKEKFFP